MANQIDERVKPFEVKMGKSIASLDSEFGTIRAGRANPHVLDRITVDYYGTPTPLQQVANISVPEARMIQIQPWESSLIKGIEKAILVSDLGLNPSNDGKVIRLVFPELTEEEELVMRILMRQGDLHINAMVVEADIPVNRMSALLFELEMKGVVKAMVGGVYHLLT